MLDHLTTQTAGWALEDAIRAQDMQTAAMLTAFHSSNPGEALQNIKNKWRTGKRSQDPLAGWADLARHMKGQQGVDKVKELRDNLEGARLVQEMRDKKNAR